jgi:hypothetical protein
VEKPKSAGPHNPVCVFLLMLSIWVSAGISGAVFAQRNVTALRHPPALDDILLRAGRFVRETQAGLNGVVADEVYTQTVSNPTILTANGSSRRLRSEVLFTTLPDVRDLVFVRTVLAVDGRAVPDSTERFDRLFSQMAADPPAHLQQLKRESARFNIGAVVRTTGDPVFALRFLDPYYQPRFSFAAAGTARIDGVEALKLAFTEEEYPTLIAVNGSNVLASGTLWVDAANGTLVRTNVKVNTSFGIASVTVDFQKDQHLQQWVPSRMSDVYGTGTTQETKCSASYDKYRRFDTWVRISTP